jgi:hypothetical protein
LQALQEAECPKAQGFYFSPAVPKGDIDHLLRWGSSVSRRTHYERDHIRSKQSPSMSR